MNTYSEDENPAPRKRQRVTKACTSCRQAKLKCDGARPSCRKCLAAKKSCSYVAPVKRRGLRTGYVRALESLWGLTFSSIEGSEDTIRQLLLTRPGWSGWIRDDIDDFQSEESPISTWRSSSIPQILDSLLASDKEKEECGLELPAASEEPSAANLSWASHSIVAGSQMLTQSDVSDEHGHSSGHKIDTGSIGIDQPEAPSADAFQPPEALGSMNVVGSIAQPSVQRPDLPRNAQVLLHQFFSMTHPWIPIFQRHAVFRTLFEYRRQSANPALSVDWRTGENALLWAILAHATIGESFSKHGNTTSGENVPEFPNTRYRIARDMIPDENENQYTTSYVQALLALGLVQYSFHEWSRASLVIGQAVLVAKHIGLDQSFLTTEEQQSTWLGCFALDTLISLHTGQRPQMRSYQVKTLLPLNSTNNEEWEPWNLQQARLPEVDADLAEYEEPTHVISVFSIQLEILCIANNWMCAKSDGHSLEMDKAALLSWEKRLPMHIKEYQGTDHGHSSTPLNILHLQVLQAFVFSRLWHSQVLEWSVELRSVWLVALESMERFLKIFQGAMLPPSCNLIRTVSLLPSQSKFLSTSALVQHLRSDIMAQGPLRKDNSDSISQLDKMDEFLTMCSIGRVDAGALTPYSLDPRIQQNFTSFMGASESCPHPTVSNLMLDQMDLQDLDNASTTMLNPADMTDLSEEVQLGYLSSSEAVDVDDRNLFRKNLGFSL